MGASPLLVDLLVRSLTSHCDEFINSFNRLDTGGEGLQTTDNAGCLGSVAARVTDCDREIVSSTPGRCTAG